VLVVSFCFLDKLPACEPAFVSPFLPDSRLHMSQLRACKSATCRTGCASLHTLQRASASEQHLRCSRRARRLPTILRMSEAAAAAERDGSTDKDDHTEDPFIVVVDMETSKTIESFIDQRVYIGEGAEKQEVLLCYPADVPVVIACFDDNDMLVQVTQTEQDAVFSTAASYLRYKGLDLINTAVCLTVQGSLEEDYSTKPLHMVRGPKYHADKDKITGIHKS
jgi:hypothetical protein